MKVSAGGWCTRLAISDPKFRMHANVPASTCCVSENAAPPTSLAMDLHPEEMVECARRTFEIRKADWRRTGAFHLTVSKDQVEARFAVLRRAMEWSNWMVAYSAVRDLVATWNDEDRWEREIQERIDAEGDSPPDPWERLAGSTVGLEWNAFGHSESSRGPWPPHGGAARLDAHSAWRTPTDTCATDWNWDQWGGLWRHAPKIGRDPSRSRGVQVKSCAAGSWTSCDRQLTEQILEFYDHAPLYRALQNVVGLPDHTWGIRFEGGIYLTLRDPTCRAVHELKVVQNPA
jgi:hypothetical protein